MAAAAQVLPDWAGSGQGDVGAGGLDVSPRGQGAEGMEMGAVGQRRPWEALDGHF